MFFMQCLLAYDISIENTLRTKVNINDNWMYLENNAKILLMNWQRLTIGFILICHIMEQ